MIKALNDFQNGFHFEWKKLKFYNFSQNPKITEPILGMFILIWMHFSCWIQIIMAMKIWILKKKKKNIEKVGKILSCCLQSTSVWKRLDNHGHLIKLDERPYAVSGSSFKHVPKFKRQMHLNTLVHYQYIIYLAYAYAYAIYCRQQGQTSCPGNCIINTLRTWRKWLPYSNPAPLARCVK